MNLEFEINFIFCRLLTLPSGWRIQFGDNVNFIFETHDLLHASPATISRMGIVNLRYILIYSISAGCYLDFGDGGSLFINSIFDLFKWFYSSTDLALATVYDSWIGKQPSPDAFATLVKQYLAKALDWTEKKSIDLPKIGVVSNVLKYTNGVINKTDFCVRLVYCLGYALNGNQQNEFAAKVSFRFHFNLDHNSPSLLLGIECVCVSNRYSNGRMFTCQATEKPNIAFTMNTETLSTHSNRMALWKSIRSITLPID